MEYVSKSALKTVSQWDLLVCADCCGNTHHFEPAGCM